MNLSAPFIHRPIATTLLALGVVLAGIVAFYLLPVAPLPQVDFPSISIQASLPGASPETMATTVAMPLERSLGRIAGVNEITSSSALGSTRITLQFDLDRDIDGAARDVQGALNAARKLLPTGMPSNPTYRKVNPADAPILILSLTSESMTRGQMYDAASTLLAQKLSQIKGIGQVSVSGSSLPAVRVELNPYALNHNGIGVEAVRAAIATSNANRPKGAVQDATRHWQIQVNDQAKKAAEYRPLIITYRHGAAVRLSDVAKVEDSVQDLRNAGLVNGKPSVLLILNRQADANIIETVDRVKALLPQLRSVIPHAIDLSVVMDRTPSIRASLAEVEHTLLIAIALVVLVVFFFLRTFRAALISCIAIPVSLLGTFIVMYLAGYSLNNLSLMALTVATGFVVDDAVVVLENISQYIEKGDSPLQAALKGSKEIGFTVLSMTLSLIAVFIPLLLMGGMIGRLFREFAVSLSCAVFVSLLVSLTLTPMMASRLLKAKNEQPMGWFQRKSQSFFENLLKSYQTSLTWSLAHSRFIMLILLATIALNVYLYVIVPKGFFPQQDVGRLSGSIQADKSISFQAMNDKLTQFVKIVQQDPAVDTVVGLIGGGQNNRGQIFVSLKPLSERKLSSDQIIARLRKKLAHEPGANLFLQAVQDIRMGGRASGAQYQYTLQADQLEELRTWEPKIRQAFSQLSELSDVNTDQQDKGLQTSLIIDRDAAARLGITPRLIDATLNGLFGQQQISTIYNSLNQYRVVMEAAPEYLQSPEILKDIMIIVPNAAGNTASKGIQVPLAAFSHFEPTNAPLSINHQGQLAASTISFNLPVGVSLSAATQAIEQKMKDMGVPSTVQGAFQGTAKVFQASLENQPWLILTALIAVYIVLGILYESLVHPLTILSTLPSAGVGAILALLMCQTEFSLIALIGVILLIGLVKKNAIMMIDFALSAEREQGMNARDAIYQACLLRFRPIMMTTLAALLGALPLALGTVLGTGDGAELRQPLGISIVGGLILSQLLTLYTTPVVYLYMDRLKKWRVQHSQQVLKMEQPSS